MSDQNQLYNERNTLAIGLARAMLALGYKAGWGMDAEKIGMGWDEDWATVLYIDLPDGAQLSYHMNSDTAEAARTLPKYDGNWNGEFTGREVPSWLIHMRDVSLQKEVDKARHIVNWLRVQANSSLTAIEKDTFVEAHNAALAIVENRA